MIRMHAALRGGVEHNRLQRPGFNCQLVVEKLPNGKERLIYTEDPLQKTNQGGLCSKGSMKTVFIYEASDSRHCPIKIFKKYISLLP